MTLKLTKNREEVYHIQYSWNVLFYNKGQAITPSSVVPVEETASYCECPCDLHEILYMSRIPMTIEEAVEKAAELKAELKAAVAVTNTSSYINTKISANDDRQSAQSIGYVGIALLAGTFGAILLFDLPILIIHFRKMIRNICNR